MGPAERARHHCRLAWHHTPFPIELFLLRWRALYSYAGPVDYDGRPPKNVDTDASTCLMLREAAMTCRA